MADVVAEGGAAGFHRRAGTIFYCSMIYIYAQLQSQYFIQPAETKYKRILGTLFRFPVGHVCSCEHARVDKK